MRCRDVSTRTHEEARWLSLYTANHVRIRAQREADRRGLDMPHASSDGGAVLLKSLDTQLQLTKRLAGCLVDTRQPGKVQHTFGELGPK
jgi:hypothetical protein